MYACSAHILHWVINFLPANDVLVELIAVFKRSDHNNKSMYLQFQKFCNKTLLQLFKISLKLKLKITCCLSPHDF